MLALNPSSRHLLRILLKFTPAQLSSVHICDLSRRAQIHRNTIRRHLHCLQANQLITIQRDGGVQALDITIIDEAKARELCD